jgi:hypothetical protein
MSGGEISGNTVRSTGSAHGGGVCAGGTFTMTGGTIAGNTALSTAVSSGTNKAYGGGVYLYYNTDRLEKTGGLIRGGSAGEESNLTVNGSNEPQTDHGHAVYVDASDEHPEKKEHYEDDIDGAITLPSLSL